MAHKIWQGTLSFGLVEIPVSLQSAAVPDDLKLVQLDRRDHAPIGYRRYNKNTGEEVAWGDVVRGYEVEDGRFVTLSDEDFEAADPDHGKVIEIVQFAGRDEIEPLFYETPYYVAPAKAGGKGYPLLVEVLEKTGRVGIARVVIRTREHMAAIYPRDGILVLDLLRFAHEVKDTSEVSVPAEAAKKGRSKPSAQELDMARRLVDEMTAPWKPEAHVDEYRERLLALVKRKGKGEVIEGVGKASRRAKAEVLDLMPLLKRSLERGASGASRVRTASAAPPRDAKRLKSTGPSRRSRRPRKTG
jgi:DNA end-binding protein Ku